MTGVSHDQLKLFYSSLARAYISPTNVTGDWPLWDTSEPVFDSYYCLWDSFRVVHPLYALLNTCVRRLSSASPLLIDPAAGRSRRTSCAL